MSQEEGFLRAITDEPGADTARLVYADWLEERGDPRADILRLEQALERCPRLDPNRLAHADWLEERGKGRAEYIAWLRGGPERLALEARRRPLLAGVGAGWLAVAGKRGPCLLALAPGEQVALELVSQGCFHHRSSAFVFSGPRPVQAEVTKSAVWSEPVARPRTAVRLSDAEVDRLDELLERCRTTLEEHGCTTKNTLKLEWHSGGKRIHQESFLDGANSLGEKHLSVLWGLLDRTLQEQKPAPSARAL